MFTPPAPVLSLRSDRSRASAPSPARPGGGADKPLGLVSAARRRASVRESLRFSLCTPVAVGSTLIAAARALLRSSFRRRSESPLLAHRETKRQEKSLASLAAADFLLVSLPASCGALTPSGCVHAANPSPFPAIRPKPSLSSQPRPPWRGSRQASRAGERCSAPSLCVGISPFFPLRPCCCGIRADSCGSRPSLKFV